MSGESRALVPPAGSRMDRSPAEVRAEGGWSVELEVPGRVWLTDLAAVRAAVFEKRDGVWYAKSRCYSCRRGLLFPLEGSYEEETVDGRHHPASVFEPGMLSPVAVRLLQHVLCSSCTVKSIEEDEKGRRRDGAMARAKESRIPLGLARDATWETIIDRGADDAESERRQAAIESCKVWARDRRPRAGVWLYGPPGSGKTRLAATAALARLEHSPVTWVPVALLMAQLQAGWDDEDRKRALKILTGKGSLVLDDLDKLNERSPAVMTQIFAAIDARDQSGATLVVTSNLKPSELAKQIGDALTSRLLGMTVPRPYPGPDHRLDFGRDAIEREAGF